MNYEQSILKQREEKDFVFKRHHHSPLTPEQKKNFKKLNYFPVSEKYRFELLIEKYEKKELIEMQTSTGDIQIYTIFGVVHFIIDSFKVQLQVYTSEKNPDYYFVPFWDKTVQTNETYGAGRYLELDQKLNNKFVLDFNNAYNPYCAYNEHFSCPLVPPENRLNVRIEAGEKKFG